ncbi:hypothetical protein DIPPA_34179 [Diplonema papillatum]|nr:hypothetical protein DIPPA_34179 [Diplonema papillatum]
MVVLAWLLPALSAGVFVPVGTGDIVYPMLLLNTSDGLAYAGTDGGNCSVKDPAGVNIEIAAPFGFAEFPFDLAEDGLYDIRASVYASDSMADSFWAQLDGGAKREWGVARAAGFSWDQFAPDSADGSAPQSCFQLSAGPHNFRLFVREPGAAVASVMVNRTGELAVLAVEGCGDPCHRDGGSIVRFTLSGMCGPDLPVTITIGGAPCDDVIFESATTLHCTAPAADSEAPVVVITQANASVYLTVPFAPPEADITTIIIIVCAVVAVLLIAGGVAMWISTAKMRAYRKLFNTASIAENLAEKIACLALDELEYLDHIENPSSTQVAFQKVVAHIKYYRTFLPQSLLAAYEDGEDAGDPSTEESGSVPGSAPGTPASKGGASRMTTASRAQCHMTPGQKTANDKPVTKKVSVLAFNLLGFSELAREPSAMMKAQKDALEIMSQAAHTFKGILDSFQGDHFIALFNCARACVTHTASAASTLMAFREKRPDLQITCGISMSTCVVATMGTATMKRQNVVGNAYLQAIVLERLCKQHPGVWNLCAPQCLNEVDVHMVTEHIDVIRMPGASSGGIVFTLIEPKVAGEDNEWMYELEAAENVDPRKAVFEMFSQNKTAEASQVVYQSLTLQQDKHLVLMVATPLDTHLRRQGKFYDVAYSNTSSHGNPEEAKPPAQK